MRKTDSRIFIAGHTGMVGSAILRRLTSLGYRNLIVRNHDALDLSDQHAVEEFFSRNAIDEIYLAAAKVGGIHANYTFPADFIYQNLIIESNIIHAAHKHKIQKLLFLGSSCIYPRNAPQPMREEYLLTGTPEPTNEPYAIAKIAGIKLCESYNRQYGRDYRSVMPTNLYGPGDNYHPENSHVIPGLLRRFHQAKLRRAEEVVVWGSGNARREFLHVDDLGAACVHLMALDQEIYRSAVSPQCSHVNVGTGVDCSIRELAELISRVAGFSGAMRFDDGKPDGAPRKLLDVAKLRGLGWQSTIPLSTGLREVYIQVRPQLDKLAAEA